MEMTDWNQVYRNVAHTYDRDNELVSITRESARLALSAIKMFMETDVYHNYAAAEYELKKVLND